MASMPDLGTLLTVVVFASMLGTVLAFCVLDLIGSRYWVYGSMYNTKHNTVLTSPLRAVQSPQASALSIDGVQHSGRQAPVSKGTWRTCPAKSVPANIQVPSADGCDEDAGVDLQRMAGAIQAPLSC